RSSFLFEVKPPTGEPDAGDPPVRFGGRGIRIQSFLPTPISRLAPAGLIVGMPPARSNDLEQVRFIFWELLKILGVSFLSLLAVKGVASLKVSENHVLVSRLARAKVLLYALVLAMAVFGAWNFGYDIAAEVYYRSSLSDTQHTSAAKNYLNALQAVQLRPGALRYWQALESTKFALGQWASVVDDASAMERVAGRELDEVDSYRIAVSLYYLGRYDEGLRITERLIRQNRLYLPPLILQGHILIAQKQYGEAERLFGSVLNVLPTDQLAVEGLAHAYFLEGNRRQALKVLEDTSRFPFPVEARQRFEALKGLYGQ
ncbi:MAG: tetratricopeptide repeat protein, partial [Terriglobia bacterium]